MRWRVAPLSPSVRAGMASTATSPTTTGRDARPGTLRSSSRSAGRGRGDEHDAGDGCERGQSDLVVVPVARDERGPRHRRRRCHDVEDDARAPTWPRPGRAARARSAIQPIPRAMSTTSPQSRSGICSLPPTTSTSAVQIETRSFHSYDWVEASWAETTGAATSPTTPTTATIARSRATTHHETWLQQARPHPRSDEPDEGEERRGPRGRWAG